VDALDLQISLKDGPVKIPSLAGIGASRKLSLWEGISAAEFYPPNVESAFYQLTLTTSVSLWEEARPAEKALVNALELLAWAWPFSGGSFLPLVTHRFVTDHRYESNVAEVESELLARIGRVPVSASMSSNYEALSTYLAPPLEAAVKVANRARVDPLLQQLMKYFSQAYEKVPGRPRPGESSWAMDLYKVRDSLKNAYGGERKAKRALGLDDKDGEWSDFGDVLNNNDLRHAHISGEVKALDSADVNRVFAIGRKWIVSYLHLPAVFPI
jgi:hypothetical protein